MDCSWASSWARQAAGLSKSKPGNTRRRSSAPRPPPAQAQSSAGEAGRHLSDAFKAKLETLDLRSGQIKDELARNGKIVRRKAQDLGEPAADAATDARIVAAIKAKYTADPDLSVWKISVASDQGHVALSGTVSAEENIGKAVALALEADGVRDVTSTLTVKPNP